MYEVSITSLNNADIPSLAEIKSQWLQFTTLSKDTPTFEKIMMDLEDDATQSQHYSIITLYDEHKSLKGWMNIYTGFLKMAFIDNWNPYVNPVGHTDDIARTLIEKAKEYIQDLGMDRLEIELADVDANPDSLTLYSRWYENAGFQWAAEEMVMGSDIRKIEIQKTPLPPSYELVPIDAMNNDIMKEPFFESFSNSLDTLFLSMTPEQQLISFDHWFNRTRPMIEGASYALLFENQCIGFVIARVENAVAEIGPIGIVPSHRRKGLSVSLLSNCLYELKRQGTNIARLYVSVNNEPAIKLYKKFGFVPMKKQVFYYWAPED